MKKTLCKICLNTGKYWDGTEFQECPKGCILEELTEEDLDSEIGNDDYPFEDQLPDIEPWE